MKKKKIATPARKNAIVREVGKLTFAFNHTVFVRAPVSMATCLPSCHSAI